MKLPKYSPLDVLYTDPQRLSGSIFTMDGVLWVAVGLEVNGRLRPIEDTGEFSQQAKVRLSALPYYPDDAVFGAARVLPPEALEEMCNFIPPACMFKPRMTNMGMGMLRRVSNTNPLMTSNNLRFYLHRRDERTGVHWKDPRAVSITAIARAVLDMPEGVDWRKAWLSLAVNGQSLLHPSGLAFVAQFDSRHVDVYSNSSCRSRIALLVRRPYDKSNQLGIDSVDPPYKAAIEQALAEYPTNDGEA